ncbi:MAG: type II CAAX prenyl endopeptidase Rce1 family protein [Candidatus Thorarchaeota archaeon]
MSVDAENEIRITLILTIFGTCGYLAGLPYLSELSGSPSIYVGGFVLSTAINIAIITVMIFLGLRLGRKVGLGAPIINADMNNEPVGDKLKAVFKIAPFLGIISGVLVFVFTQFVFSPMIPSSTPSIIPSLGSRVLTILYGGIYEELFLRLFILTVIVWFVWRIKMKEDGTPYMLTFWVGIILSVLVFSLLNLSTIGLAMEITSIIVIRAIVLNGIPAVIFGWLYWKQGIESAIVAHIFADITIHVILQQILLTILL